MVDNALTTQDFAEFYQQVHGFEPFGWQTDLLAQIVAESRWPDLIDLPTGTGKTSVLDIAVFALALDAQDRATKGWAPRRIVMIVDRRIVVDQAHLHAMTLEKSLKGSLDENDGRARGRVARALRDLSPGLESLDSAPLYAGLLRGGQVRDNRWALRPDRALILSATVDQIGSRLLFRGYGVSGRSASIHAGLLGNDTLIVLDEVHLSRPFKETLQQLAEKSPVRGGLEQRTQTVLLSATPGPESGTRFPSRSLRSDEVEPVLASRLRAQKPVRLDVVKVAANLPKSDQDFARRVASETIVEIRQDHAQLMGVVVNRVDTARRVAELLEGDRTVKKLGAEVHLITGRMRPADRDSLLSREIAGWSDRTYRKPENQILVATQCIEAGADLDLDGLVTECASIDALRQRFGRVDRRGVLTEQGTRAQGVILLRGETAPEFDAVYGSALAETWRWLGRNDPVDFGIEKLGQTPDQCIAQRVGAPVLTRLHLRALSHTSPPPSPDHVVSRWLHGDESDSPSVSIVWRSEIADLADLLVRQANGVLSRDQVERELSDRIGFCSPLSRESVEVPMYAAVAWLIGTSRGAEPISDTESMVVDEARNTKVADLLPWVLWRDQTAHIMTTDHLRPGDTIVVPTWVGGLSRSNWDPTSTEVVEPVVEACAAAQRNRLVCLIGPPHATDRRSGSLGPKQVETTPDYPDTAGGTHVGDSQDAEWAATTWNLIQQAIGATPDESPETLVRLRFAQGLIEEVARRLDVQPSRPFRPNRISVAVTDEGFIGISYQLESDTGLPAGISGSYDDASFTGSRSAPLDEHLYKVGDIAARFAANLGLGDELVKCMRLAGELHDLGKFDQRFQSWLVDGGPPPLVPIAKSARTYHEAERREAARIRSGYPRGARHEMLSLRIAEAAEVLDQAPDPELVAHLVTSHHGLGRPFAPPVLDVDPVEVDATFDLSTDDGNRATAIAKNVTSETHLAMAGSGIARRFEMLTDRYGEHGLAWLEAIFRLADHRRSEFETHRERTARALDGTDIAERSRS